MSTYFEWSQLETDKDILFEIREGFWALPDNYLRDFMVAYMITEFDISPQLVKEFREKIIDLHGDPLDSIDDETGQLNIDTTT